MYLDALIERYQALGLPAPLGGTAEMIAAFEATLQVRLPAAYREFLAWGGGSEVAFFAGSDYTLRRLPRLQRDAVELLEDAAAALRLPEDAIVFWMHQGYMLRFLRASEGDDPPTYFFREEFAERGFQPQEPLSKLLDGYLDGYITQRGA